MNTVLDGYPVLDPEHFVCGVPAWVAAALRAFFLLSGCALPFLVTGIPGATPATTAFLLAVSGVSILLALRPARPSVRFACDRHGAYFPALKDLKKRAPATPRKWLLVPWANVQAIKVQLMPDESGVKKLVTLSLRASESERQDFFAEASTSTFPTKEPTGEPGSILMAYPSTFKSPYKTVAILSRLRHLGQLMTGKASAGNEHGQVHTTSRGSQ